MTIILIAGGLILVFFVGNWLPYEEFLVTKVHNLSFKAGLLEGNAGLKISLGLGIVSAAYGGLHASEWYSFFPTRIECYLWRISAAVVPAVGIGIAVAGSLNWERINLSLYDLQSDLHDRANVDVLVEARVPRVLSHLRKSLFSVLLVVFKVLFYISRAIFMASVIFYVLCRMVLVVEAFVSIRELPLDAYRTPAWTQLLPHL